MKSRLGTPSSLADQNTQNRVCHSENVDPKQYVKVQLPNLGTCWAYVVRTSKEEQQQTGERYAISVLGWGMDAVPFWDELSKEVKTTLLAHARQNEGTLKRKLIPFEECGFRSNRNPGWCIEGTQYTVERVSPTKWLLQKVVNKSCVFSKAFKTRKDALLYTQGVLDEIEPVD